MSLFTKPLGLQYIADIFNSGAERSILNEIDQRPWNSDLKRRVQHYGYRYDYKVRSIALSDRLGPMPDWAEGLATRLHLEGHFATKPDQVIVNEYEPGQGISAHVDCEPCFGPVIASLSLLSACDMVFRRKVTGDVFSLRLERRSLLVLSGEARYAWTHEIPARKSDMVNGERVSRKRRISLTFRSVTGKASAGTLRGFWLPFGSHKSTSG